MIGSTRTQNSPQFSPDGKSIAFASERSGSPEIWMCDSEGRNPIQLTSFGGPEAGTPRWSPDGKELAFDSHAKGDADIYLLSVEGGVPRRITFDNSVMLCRVGLKMEGGFTFLPIAAEIIRCGRCRLKKAQPYR